jgi:RND family efflux transporter MFP subunit
MTVHELIGQWNGAPQSGVSCGPTRSVGPRSIGNQTMPRLLPIFLVVAGCLPALCACAAETMRIEDAVLKLIEEVELPAKEPGPLAEVSTREGDIVEVGRRLAAVEDAEADVAVTKAESELAVARAKAENDVAVRLARKAHEVAAAEYRRALESVEKFQKSVSQTELDQLRLSTEKALLAIEQAELDQAVARLGMRQKEAELETARLKLQRHRLLAPFAGMVAEIRCARSEWVNPGDTVLRLVRLDRLRVEGFVPARQFAARPGQSVAVFVDVPGRGRTQFSATLMFASPEVNPVNGQILIWAEVDNQELLLKPGQTATLEIESDAPIHEPIEPQPKS